MTVCVCHEENPRSYKQVSWLCQSKFQNCGHTTGTSIWSGRDNLASGETERVKILNGKATTVCVCHGAISKKIDGRGMCGRLAGRLSD